MIDLHCHSTFSDGSDTPESLVRQAEAAGLHALALTDHDTLDGLSPFLALQPTTQVRLVPGIELSCRFLGRELHLLGLLLDPTHPQLRAKVNELRLRREDRNRRMLIRLQDMGHRLEWEDVAREAPNRLISRAHFARALARLGAVSQPADAFRRIIGDGCPGHIPFHDLEPAEACRWIREAGGVPVVAHPGRSAHRAFRWEEAMALLKSQGVAGFEAMYGEYGTREEAYFTALARDLDMAPSGGSDYHGSYKPGIQLGVGKGGLNIPDAWLAGLEARRANI